MKCHYEVLNVERDSDEKEITKSYRKLALKYHPDKNPDSIEECTRQFHLVQQAYEVLTDPQERVFYDKHREEILKGGLGKGGEYKDDCLNVYEYFNSACYSGFDDREKGFYTVYRKIFEQISTEDVEYVDDPADMENLYPDFGNSESSFDDVLKFYGRWDAYSTKKSYVWVDKYDIREAPNRFVRRQIERENKKQRDKARKERNEEVQALVAYVKKRDKRLSAYRKKLEERKEEIARQTQERMMKDRQERQKRMEDFREAEWSSMATLEKELEMLEKNVSAEFQDQEESSNDTISDEEEIEDLLAALYCPACDRMFKTAKAKSNHENSKKHKENVALLRKELNEEDFDSKTDSEDLELLDNGIDDVEEEDIKTVEKTPKKSKKQKKKEKKFLKNQDFSFDNDGSVSEDGEHDKDNPSNPDNIERAKETEAKSSAVDQKLESSESENELETIIVNSSKKSRKNKRKKKSAPINVLDDVIKPEDMDESSCNSNQQRAEETYNDANGLEKVSKKAKRREKNYQKVLNSTNNTQQNFCNTCSKEFASKNKLFIHLKETGHALRLEDDKSDNGKKKTVKKGKQ